MISINELHNKWNNISPFTGGFLLVSGDYPLSFHIGYVNRESKCFMVLNTGKVDRIPSSKAILAECVQTTTGENTWSEIKATSIASDAVTISSIQQLDCSDNGNLIVYFMDKTSSKGQLTISLPKMITRIKVLLSAQYYDEFSCKLAKNGYFDKDAEHYESYCYRLAEKRTYIVDSTFPRLIRNNIPAEIANARYELSLTAIDAHRV